MRLCDRCPKAGTCLLNYLGPACRKSRREGCPDVMPNTAEILSDQDLDGMSAMISDYAIQCGASGIPGMNQAGIREWLEQEHNK